MDTNNKWEYEKYWSLKKYPPRLEQINIINEICSAMEMGFKNIILEAGTGIGKSAIATTVAKMVEDSYILTMTNQLQTQYLQDFEYMLTEIKGRSNYACNYGGSCAECQMEKDNEKKCNDCLYIWSLREAQKSKNIITNYDYLYYAGNYAGLFGERSLLILDESHNFEKKIMSLTSKTLNRKTIIKKYGFDIFSNVKNGATLKSIENKDYWINISEKLLTKIKNQYPRNNHEVKKKELEIKKYTELIHILKHDDWIIELPTKKNILADTDYKTGLKVEFKPLTIKDYSENLLQFGETRLFLTGTLGNKEKFCQWIGIDPNETYYIYMKSPFSVEHRPIHKEYVGSMSGKNNNNTPNWYNPEAITQINKIIIKHADEKGVIHTSSNQQAWYLKKKLNSRNIWVASGKTREKTIKEFEKSKKPIILIGAGIKDGVDFKGDKCRYQIIFKMPYPSLASKQTIIRAKTDQSWYDYQTIMPLMQAYGRGIRDSTDECVLYILDSDFEKLLNNARYLFNEYFLEAIMEENKIKRVIPIPKLVYGE